MMKNINFLFLFYTFFLNSVISQDLIPYNKNGKWGYADKKMNLIIPCTYDYAMPFYEERALVGFFNNDSLNHKSEYFIDKEGQIIFGTLSTSSSDFSATRFQHGMAFVENYKGQENCVSLVDKYGTALIKLDSARLEYELGTKAHTNSFNHLGFYVTNFHGSSYISNFIYTDRRTKRLDSINVYKFYGPYASAYHDPNSFLIDSSGKTVLKSDLYQIISYSEDLLRVTDKEQQYGFLNLKGKVVIKTDLDFADDFSDGLAVYGITNPKYNADRRLRGYMNKKGKSVIPAIYDNAYSFSEGLADVVMADSLFFIDKKGNKVLKFRTNSDYDMFDFTHGFRMGLR